KGVPSVGNSTIWGGSPGDRRPIFPPCSVNHRLPSLPCTIPHGKLCGVGTAKSVIVGVIARAAEAAIAATTQSHADTSPNLRRRTLRRRLIPVLPASGQAALTDGNSHDADARACRLHE